MYSYRYFILTLHILLICEKDDWSYHNNCGAIFTRVSYHKPGSMLKFVKTPPGSEVLHPVFKSGSLNKALTGDKMESCCRYVTSEGNL